jgi:hypothetical protein
MRWGHPGSGAPKGTILELFLPISWQACHRLRSLLDWACSMIRSEGLCWAKSHIPIIRHIGSWPVPREPSQRFALEGPALQVPHCSAYAERSKRKRFSRVNLIGGQVAIVAIFYPIIYLCRFVPLLLLLGKPGKPLNRTVLCGSVPKSGEAPYPAGRELATMPTMPTGNLHDPPASNA